MILVALAAGIIQMRVLYGSGMISKTWYDVVSLVGKDGAMPLPRTILHEQIPVIEVAERWLLDVLVADHEVGRYLLRLSDLVAVAAPEHLDIVIARLRQLGHTPKVVEE